MISLSYLQGRIAEYIVKMHFWTQGYTQIHLPNQFTQIDITLYKPKDEYMIVEIKQLNQPDRQSQISWQQFYKQYLYMQSIYITKKYRLKYTFIVLDRWFRIIKEITVLFNNQNPYNLYNLLHQEM